MGYDAKANFLEALGRILDERDRQEPDQKIGEDYGNFDLEKPNLGIVVFGDDFDW